MQSAPSAARLRGIRAGSAYGAWGRSSHNPPVVGSIPTRPTSLMSQALCTRWKGSIFKRGGQRPGKRASLDRDSSQLSAARIEKQVLVTFPADSRAGNVMKLLSVGSEDALMLGRNGDPQESC